MRYKYWIGIGASIVLGLFFVSAGLGKLLHQAEVFEIFFVPFQEFLTTALANAFFAWLPWLFSPQC